MARVNNKVFDRDHFNTQRIVGPARACGQVLDALQDHEPEAQVAGLAVAFITCCKQFGIREGDAIAAAYRMKDRHPNFGAAEDYLREECYEAR